MSYHLQVNDDNSFDVKKISFKADSFFDNLRRHLLDLSKSSQIDIENGTSIRKSFNTCMDSIFKLNWLEGIDHFDGTKLPVGIMVSTYDTLNTEFDNLIEINNSKKNIFPNTIYPLAVRFINKSGKFYIERPPFQVNVVINNKVNKSVKIWIPWSISIVDGFKKTPEMKIFFSHKSLTDESQLYHACTLPNIYNDARVCFNHSLDDAGFIENSFSNGTSLDVRQVYSFMFNEYMNGGWNCDLGLTMMSGLTGFYNKIKDPKSDDLREQYPTLSKFFEMDEKLLKELNPKLSAKTVNAIMDVVYRFSFYSYNSEKVFDFVFTSLSRFSLEETLSFYEELCLFSSKELAYGSQVREFYQMVMDNYESGTRLEYLDSHIVSSLMTHSNGEITPVFNNSSSIHIYINNFEDKDNPWMINPSQVSYFNPSQVSYYSLHGNSYSSYGFTESLTNKYFKIISDILVDFTSKDTSGYYLIDATSNSYTYHETNDPIPYRACIKYISENENKSDLPTSVMEF